MKLKSIGLILFVLCSTMPSCQNKSEENSLTKEAINEEKQSIEQQKIVDLEEINLLIGSIPPPIQVASTISKNGYKYDNSFLCSVEKSDKYTDSLKQAFGLGIFGTDLAYTQVFEQSADGLVYFETVFKLSEALQIDYIFDKKTITKLSQNDNVDSLLTISIANMEKVNQHFIDHKTPEFSVLIMMGSWLESSYLLCKSYEQKPSQELATRIAEQQVSLEILEEIFKKFQKNDGFSKYSNQLKPIITQFAKIEVVEQKVKGTAEHKWNKDGSMTIVEGSETQVIVDKKDLENLIKLVVLTRNKLIL